MASAPTLEISEAAILTRVIRPQEDTLSPAVAQALLRFQLDPADRNRLHELAVKNQEGRLTTAEQRELHSYLNVGMLLDLLQAKARVALKDTKPSRR